MLGRYRLELRSQYFRGGGADRGMMVADNRLQGCTQTAQQIPAIDNMNGRGSALVHALAADLRGVAGDNLLLRMTAQPRGHGCSLPLWQDIRDGFVFPIDNDGAVGAPPALCLLVDADRP